MALGSGPRGAGGGQASRPVLERVWLKPRRDRREADNMRVVAEGARFRQKHGPVTWRPERAREWARGFAVLQGPVLAVFERSDLVVGRPEAAVRLAGCQFRPSDKYEHAIRIQVAPAPALGPAPSTPPPSPDRWSGLCASGS